MKAGKLVTTLLLALWCILFVNACGLFDGGSPPTPSPTPPAMTVAEAETKLRQAEENLQRLRTAAEAPKPDPSEIQKLETRSTNLRKAATHARNHAEALRQQTIKIGKNPDRQRDAPITYKAVQDANAAEEKAAQARDKLAQAKGTGGVAPEILANAERAVFQASKDLEGAKASPQASPASSPSSSTETSPSPPTVDELPVILTTLLPFLLTTVPLLIVIGLFHRSTSQKLDQLRQVFMERTSELKGEVRKLDSIIRDGKTGLPEVLELSKKVEQFQGNLGEVLQQAFARQEAETARARAADIETADREERISFPMPAEDYLSRMQGKLRFVKHDYPNRMLIEDSDTGDIALVTDNAPKGMAYAVPKLNRFPTKQEYYTIYENYFECNSPYSGFVVIVKPALVEAVEGGWELREKGQLRVGG